MADYIFNRYRDESLGYPSSLNLYGVRLVLQKAELTSFETGSSEVTWTYTIKEENHQYYPETNVFVPFDLSGTGLKNYAWDNRNSFFPPDLIGKAWINAPIYKAGFHTVELTTSALLPRSQRERNSPKPPDRWVIEFDFEDGHRVCPSYEDLITGYSRDKRFIPDKLKITSSINQEVKVEYYRSNPYEQIPNLEYIDPEANFVESTYDAIDITKSRMRSIDWHVMELQLVANRAATIDIAGIVLGTLRINSPNLLIVGHSDINETLYPAKYLLNNISYLDELFNNWSLLYNDEYIRQISLNYLLECQATDRKLRFSYTGLGFNSSIVSVAITEGFNNYWNNYQLFNYSDYLCNPRMNRQFKIQVLNYHPFFKSLPLAGFDGFINIDQTLFLDTKRRIFDKCNQNYYSFNHANLIKWQLKPQIDRQNNSRGIGAIAMDSPRVIEIHKALDAQKYSENDVEPSEPRVSNLGWHINRQSEILGIKVRADGTIDKDLARKQVRTVIDKATRLDPDKVGVGNFGESGMVTKRINNRFKRNQIVSDQCVINYDLIQLIQEHHDQSNLAFGIQESSAIELTSGNKTARFDNQMQILIEIFNLLNTSTEMQRSTLVSSLISQGQTSEIISGLGLPSVTKTIPITINDKTTELPYKGISPHRSISQEVATCTANVGIVLGQLL